MKDKLQNKIALITGASKGIGRAISEALSSHNMKLGLMARSEEKLKEVAERVNSAGSEALVLSVDLKDQKAIAEAVCELKQKFGLPHFLINNAGVGVRGLWNDIPLDSELDVMAVNYTAPVILIRLLLPGMMQADRGHVININAIGGIYAAPYQGIYCASKAALLAYSSSLAYELEKTNVNISSVILSGPVDTDLLNATNFQSFKNFKGVIAPELVAESVLSVIQTPKETVCVGPSWKLLLARISNFRPGFFRKLIEKKNTPPEQLTVSK